MLIGVSDRHSAYKIWMLEDKKVVISRDVRFYEEVFPYKSDLIVDLMLLNPIECRRSDVTTRETGFGQI